MTPKARDIHRVDRDAERPFCAAYPVKSGIFFQNKGKNVIKTTAYPLLSREKITTTRSTLRLSADGEGDDGGDGAVDCLAVDFLPNWAPGLAYEESF